MVTQKWRPEENNSGASMASKSPKAGGQADDAKRGLSRRQVLGEGSALLGGALASGVAAGQASAQTATANTENLPPNVPEWMKAPGDPMGSQLYGMPSPFEKNVVKNISKKLPQYISASGRTPLQDLDGIITPNGLFYERHHGGVPTIG
jgi:sulfane dehydrogenase subunit SoxC